MKALITLAVFLLNGIGSSAMAQDGSFKIIDIVSGRTQQIIQAAMPAIAAEGLNPANYQVIVAESTKSFFVVLKDPSTPIERMVSTPNVPAFQVEVGKDKLQVIRAHFIR